MSPSECTEFLDRRNKNKSKVEVVENLETIQVKTRSVTQYLLRFIAYKRTICKLGVFKLKIELRLRGTTLQDIS